MTAAILFTSACKNTILILSECRCNSGVKRPLSPLLLRTMSSKFAIRCWDGCTLNLSSLVI